VRKALALAAALAAIWTTSSTAATPSENVAGCDRQVTTIGSGPDNWRKVSELAGPLAVFRDPLRQMSEAGNGQLMTKMPVLVARGVPVTLSVPDRLQSRVFLYYGLYFRRDGTRSTTFLDSPGFASIEFQPCDAKPRTAWPGGVRIKGRAPVHLNVTVAGSSSPTRLRLGRPRPLD
jgi:hypothetical protein